MCVGDANHSATASLLGFARCRSNAKASGVSVLAETNMRDLFVDMPDIFWPEIATLSTRVKRCNNFHSG